MANIIYATKNKFTIFCTNTPLLTLFDSDCLCVCDKQLIFGFHVCYDWIFLTIGCTGRLNFSADPADHNNYIVRK